MARVTDPPQGAPVLTKPAPLTASHSISGFNSRSPVLNDWFTRRALPAQESKTARTFVVCHRRTVVGYYSLATAIVKHSDASSSLRRNSPDPIPAILLARLAVDIRHEGRGLGPDLLQDAFLRTLKAAKQVAARTLLVHAIDDKAVNFYKKHGFLRLEKNSDGGFATLHMPLATIEKLA